MSHIIHPTEAAIADIDPRWFRDSAVSSIVFAEPCLWLFTFSSGVVVQPECLWRLLDGSHIVLTSEDHRQQFGLPAPVDAAAEASRLLAEDHVVDFTLRSDTLDLLFTFSRGHRLEILPTSSGYEAWSLSFAGRRFIAVGGGRLDSYSYTDET
jgi:hypothetical protein